MSDSSEDLNLKMLDRAAEEFESRRRDFFRDLKIAVTLVLAFQFFIFFRFVQLSEDKLRVDGELARMQTNYVALTNIHLRVAAIGENFEQSAGSLLGELEKVPANLRARIQALETDIIAFRKVPDPLAGRNAPTGSITSQSVANAPFSPVQESPEIPNAPLPVRPPGTATPNLALQVPPAAANMAFQGSPATESGERGRRSWPQFAGLGTNELKTLHDAPTDDPAFRGLVNRLVVEQIIQPNFDWLNERWRSSLADPFASARTALLARTDDWIWIERAGFSRDQLTTNLAAVEQTLRSHRFQPPASPAWWTTYGGKLDQSREMRLDAQRTAAGLTDSLALSRRQISAFKDNLDALIEKTRLLQAATEDELLKVQTNAAALQSLLQTYITPIPYVPFGPREAVLYFPVMVAGAYLFFTWRHLRLRRRAAELSEAYARLGVTPEVRALIFAAPGGVGRFRLVTGLLLLTPVVFAAASAWQLWNNRALRAEVPQFLLLLSGLLLAASCAVLLRSLFPGKHRRDRQA